MGTYQPLFTVAVEHKYFADGLWRGLEFSPAPGTLKLVRGADLLVKRMKNGVGVFYDRDRAAALRLFAEAGEGLLRFDFKVSAPDRKFSNYTAPALEGDGSVLRFDSRGKARDGVTGKVWLSREGFASGQDFCGVDELVSEGILDAREQRMPPDFVASIFMDAAATGDIEPADYGIRFNARHSIWKYHLLGNMNRSNPYIVDMDSQVEFEFCGEVMLPDSRQAKVFRSTKLLPLMERSTYRFQLREPGPGNGRVLIKRLPVASESRLGVEVVDGRREIVMESFVNY